MQGEPSSYPALNTARLWNNVQELASITQHDVPWTRRAFTPLFMEGREWLRKKYLNAGLTIEQDAGGNLIGRLSGTHFKKPLITGSHCDTVVGGGRYDGIIGVLAGIEIAQTLNENSIQLQHPFEVIDFLSEEPSDYGVSCIGSRALTGKLSPEMLHSKNTAGESLAAAMRRIGANPEALSAPLRSPESVAAFLELHIEQGPLLEKTGIQVGAVTNIVGIRRVRIVVTGQPDHAGTTPMHVRRDALVGAAGIIRLTHSMASRLTGQARYVVATVGSIVVTPNASNAIPGSVELILEVRSDYSDVLDSFPEELMQESYQDLAGLRLSATCEMISQSKPTSCSPIVISAVQRACEECGFSCMCQPSGAGHDAVYMESLGPMGMVFIPCLQGRSHCPEESVEMEQLSIGAMALYQSLVRLDRGLLNEGLDSFVLLKTLSED